VVTRDSSAAASLLWRELCAVPTTLLALVDSSVALIRHQPPARQESMIGASNQPSRVVADLAADTLPQREADRR
jgi:3-dehydroquinate synthetase